ncbi:general substrate transporter [Microdochium trichocladiopsis]|uniref:General substrate transporter n=1 Tax=Microdochium trichocladiopsis TaxID=1682393 RepID=A0A9P8YD50_9PEZI|nr:general substrate transporter [Microdochium trichocladiopsis]KAH7037039.1 general substrate transporter [Microdochium trichocladiopsis]
MGKLTNKEGNTKIVGAALAEVLPDTDKWWWQQPHLLSLNLRLSVLLLSSSVTGYDGSLMNGLQTLPQWASDFGNPAGISLGLVNAAMVIGSIAAMFAVSQLADIFGRRLPIAIGALGTVVATIIQIFSVNYGMFVASRGLLGLFSGLMITPSALLIAELSYPTHRGKLTSAFFTLYYSGAILAAWVTFGTQNLPGSLAWKIPTIFQGLLPLTQVILLWFVPESPRWLVAKDRVANARDVLARYHDPRPDSQLVAREMSEIVESIQMEQEAKNTNWLSLVATPGNRKRLAITLLVGTGAQLNGVAVTSYYLTKVLSSVGITSPFDQNLINGMLQIFNFGAALGGAFLVDKLGRRTIWLWSTSGMLLSYIAWTACSAVNNESGNSGAGIAVVIFIFVVYFHYDIAWTPLLVAYPAEIWTYSLRAKGMAVEFFFNSCALLIAQFVNPVGMEALGWKYYFVFVAILCILLTLIWFLFVETKGYSLEEIAVIFDGERAETSLAADKRLEGVTAEHKEDVA